MTSPLPRLRESSNSRAFIRKTTGGVPSAEIKKVVETAAVRLTPGIEMPIEAADIASSKAEGRQQYQGLEALKVIEMELILQGIEERFEFWRETDDFEHVGNLLSIYGSVKLFIEEIACFY